MDKYKNVLLSVIFLTGLILSINSQQVDWTHFRGSNLDGKSAEKSVPVRWNDSTGLAWKVKIDGKGWSSPVVYGNQIWLTTATEDGRQMFAVCRDFNTGRELFNIKLFEPQKVFSKHNINTYATPTPCIEKDFVYLHFGTYGTACLRTGDGSVVWKRTDLNCDHVQGPGASPIIYKNMLILHIEGTDVQYVIALNKTTGETIWKTDRPPECYEKLKPIGKKAYITPLIINVNGKDLLISNGSAVCIAYEVETGKEVWRFVEGEDSTIAMPVTENGIVYFITSFVTPPQGENYCELLAVDPAAKGDIEGTRFIKWRIRLPQLQLLTPVIKNGLIYIIDTKNILQCIDAASGNAVYTSRLRDKYNSSPVWADGKIYFTSMNGETMVIREGRKLEILATSKINGEVFATPAILRKSIIMRSNNYLYRIAEN